MLAPTPTIAGTRQGSTPEHSSSPAPGTRGRRRPTSGPSDGDADRRCDRPDVHPFGPALLGAAITASVTSTREFYATVVRTTARDHGGGRRPRRFTPTPTVTGTPQVGLTLTAIPGSWDGGVTLGLPVVRSTAPTWSTEATAPDLRLSQRQRRRQTGDLGQGDRHQARGRGGQTKESVPTGPVAVGAAHAHPDADGQRHAEGRLRLLTAVAGHLGRRRRPSPTSGPSRAPTSAAPRVRRTPPVGRRRLKWVTVKVTGSKNGYTSVAPRVRALPRRWSAAVRAATPTPTISGTPKVGPAAHRSTRSSGTTGQPLAYQWTVGGVRSNRRHGARRTPRCRTTSGKVVRVEVTGTRTGFDPVTKWSPTRLQPSRSAT